GVFEHDVAGRAGCVGAAAEPAERGVELAAAGVEGGEHVGDAEPAGVVEMRGDRERRDIADDSAEYALDRRRLTVADRIGEDDAIGAGFGDLVGDADDAVFVDITLDRAAERGGEAAIDPDLFAAVPAELDDAAEILDRFAGRAAHVGEVVPLADREDVVHLGDAAGEAALCAARVRDQGRDVETGFGHRVGDHR